MDSILEQIIIKHAEKNGIDKEEAFKIYKEYRRQLSIQLLSVYNGTYAEVRVPYIARFVFSEKKLKTFVKHLNKYRDATENRAKVAEKNKC
jgi:hypothetical protein